MISWLKASSLGPYLAWVRIGAIALAVAIVFGAGWATQGWRKDAAHAESLRVIDAEYIAALKDSEARRAKTAAAYAEIDVRLHKELTDAQNDNEKLRADVDAGGKRLLVRARCSTSDPADTSGRSPGVGDGASAVLDPAARRDYFALRSNILITEKKLEACQGLLRKGLE